MGAGGLFALGEDVGWRFIMHEAIAALESIRGCLDDRGMRRLVQREVNTSDSQKLCVVLGQAGGVRDQEARRGGSSHAGPVRLSLCCHGLGTVAVEINQRCDDQRVAFTAQEVLVKG